ncbi:uncharacterized protein LODBEIA_P60870 [Lodderomyces beijingensis]|uniref:nicotinamidase n=1 Tax=Lodderomyces beijingensis TaxID=1775926 RepID=A0ABP0ZUQ3_9ASCO
MVRRALVVVDLQEDFLPPDGTLAIKEGRSIVPRINELIKGEQLRQWALVVATQDWHPANHACFASQHGVEPFTQREFARPQSEAGEKQMQVLWPDHCVQGTHGSRLAPSFADAFERIGDKTKTAVVRKGYLQDREFYSCFQDCWGLHHTEMESILQENQVDQVVFVGLAYDYCVLRSAVDCAKKWKSFVVKKLCKSVSPEKEDETDATYRKNGVVIVDDVSEIL